MSPIVRAATAPNSLQHRYKSVIYALIACDTFYATHFTTHFLRQSDTFYSRVSMPLTFSASRVYTDAFSEWETGMSAFRDILRDAENASKNVHLHSQIFGYVCPKMRYVFSHFSQILVDFFQRLHWTVAFRSSTVTTCNSLAPVGLGLLLVSSGDGNRTSVSIVA